jgi:rare lipoprotein A
VTQGRAVRRGGGIYKVGKPYKVAGRWYIPGENPNYDRAGVASWYGSAFHGRRTANGEVYDMYALTAGHPTLPLPSYAYVTNRDNGRTILVRINDRGPYVNDRLIDLSWQSARQLGFSQHGLARVRVRYAGRAPLDGSDIAERRHLVAQSWYQRSPQLARDETAPITTGSLREPAPSTAPATSGGRSAEAAAARAALGGPERGFLEVGPFATRAEAERMRHELEPLGAATVVPRITEYHVRMGPLSRAAADAVAHHMGEFVDVPAVVAPR